MSDAAASTRPAGRSVDADAINWCREMNDRVNSASQDDAAKEVGQLVRDDRTCNTWIDFAHKCTAQRAISQLAEILSALARPSVVVGNHACVCNEFGALNARNGRGDLRCDDQRRRLRKHSCA